MTKQFWTLISEIDWVKNFHLEQWAELDINSREIRDYINTLLWITSEVKWLWELERKLIENFWEWKILNNWNFRLANAIGFEWTLIRRRAEKIILPDWETEMPTKTNIGWNVIDPIAWSSKPAAPSIWYGLLGKISELRRNSTDFNEELHSQVINRIISLAPKWIAFEVWPDETVLMPVFSIEWAHDLIQQFSEDEQKSDVQTAKHYWINS